MSVAMQQLGEKEYVTYSVVSEAKCLLHTHSSMLQCSLPKQFALYQSDAS